MPSVHGPVEPHRVRPMRDVPRELRRARLLAARTYPVGFITRYAILNGHWDGGHVVGQFRARAAA